MAKTFEQLGAQYREAMEAIGTHRIEQAAAENAYGELYVSLKMRGLLEQGHPPELVALKATVDKAVADVDWCKACTVAAGEEFTGESFATKTARNQKRTVTRTADQGEDEQ